MEASSQPSDAQKIEEFKQKLKKEGLFLTDHLHIILATVTISLLSLSVPIMTLQVYDRLLGNPEGGTLPILLSGVMVAILLEAVIRIARSYIVQYAGSIFEYKMNCKLFFHTIHSDFSKIPNFDAASHQQRFHSVGDVKDDFTGSAFVAYCETFLLPIFFILLLYIGGWLTVVPIIIALLYAALAYSISLRLKEANLERDKYDETRYSYLINVLSGIHTIKAFAAEKFFERRYERFKEDVGTAHYRVAILNGAIANLGSIFSGIMTVTVITVGAYLVIIKVLTTGSLIATIIITGRIMQPVQKIVHSFIRKNEAKHSYEDIVELLDTPTDRPIEDIYYDLENTQKQMSDIRGELEIKGMSFKYAGQDEYLFEDVDFKAYPGELINIRGGFGVGKTTLMKLIAGVYPPSQGQVLVDGNPVNQYSQQELPRHVGLVESYGVLFRGSIRDNITRFGLTPEEQSNQASSLLQLNQEIIKLPAGFDTMLSGKANDVIQPDLCQRIAIARTLAVQPKLVLFDEPNRNLDDESYNILFKVLAKLKGHATIILISSDNNLSSLADTTYMIDNKKIVSA